MFSVMQRTNIGWETITSDTYQSVDEAIDVARCEVNGINGAQRYVFHYASLVATVTYVVGRWYTDTIIEYVQLPQMTN